MIMSGVVFILGLLFLIVVAPVWIALHYLTRWRSNRGLSAEDESKLGELWQSAGRMETRIASLERVLDAEAPGWRTRSGG